MGGLVVVLIIHTPPRLLNSYQKVSRSSLYHGDITPNSLGRRSTHEPLSVVPVPPPHSLGGSPCGRYFSGTLGAFTQLISPQKSILTAIFLPGLYIRERVNAYLYLFFGAKQIDNAYAEVMNWFSSTSNTMELVLQNANLNQLIGQREFVHDYCP